jgi:hypothetical protein
MENDIRNENDENLIDRTEYFKLDFSEQIIKGNRNFEEFKKQKLNELGKDAKLFHCKNDNIYFYISKKECEIHDNDNIYYTKNCPKCKNYICYFCEKIDRNYYDCCAISRIYYVFFINGIEYCEDDEEDIDFIYFLIFDLIPLTKCFLYSLLFFRILFFDILLKDKKWKKQINDHRTYYWQYLDNRKSIIYLALITYSISYSICYIIIAFYLNILILIVSLFTKFYVLKYSVGILRNSL